MPLAVSLPLQGIGLRDALDVVRRAEVLGYREAWGSEVAGPDFATVLGSVGASTDLALGVAVIPVQTRSPWLIAATAASLSELTGGRFTLGLGTSSELIVQRWSGIPFDRPLARLRETVEVVRDLLDGEKVDHDGAFLRTSGYRLPVPPPARVPIVVGALNEKSLRQAGEIGDGICLNQLGAEHVEKVLVEARAGAESAGKDPDALRVVARIFCAVTDDIAGARDLVKHVFAPYAATKGYNRFFRWLGFEEEMAGVQEAFGRRDRQAAAAALSDDFVDTIYVLGDADTVAERVQAYVDAGVDTPVIASLDPSQEGTLRLLEACADVRTPERPRAGA